MFARARRQLTLIYAATGVLMFAVLAAGILVTVVAFLDREIDADIEHVLKESEGLITLGQGDESIALPIAFGPVFLFGFTSGGVVTHNPRDLPVYSVIPVHVVQEVASTQGTERLTLAVSGERYRVHLEPVVVAGETLGVLAAGRSLARRDVEVRLFTTTLVGGGAVWTVLASVAAYLIAGRALRPVREAYARQEEFVAGAAHELRSPIGVIRAASEIGLRGDPPEEVRGLLLEINDVASDASNLVDTLLDLARMQALAHPDGAETDLAEVAARELARMDLLLREHRVHIIDDLGEVRVRAPAAAVGRVIRALLENIVQHTPPGTSVIVRTRVSGAFGELSVEDDGPGVPPEQLDSVFELFSRGDEARRRERRHSGLGLAIVESIARHYGGNVRARTAASGRGLLVEVHLPTG